MTATRIQQRRTKGWRKPPGTVSVVRGTRWGNPYKVADHGRDEAIRLFTANLDAADRAAIRRHLAGVDLMCWCPTDQPCHGDVLLRIANHGERGEADLGIAALLGLLAACVIVLFGLMIGMLLTAAGAA